MFTFNGKHDDYEQVAPYIGEFAKIRAEIIERTGRSFVYNDDFRDRIPAIANKEMRPPAGSHEDSAIYMLQKLYRWWEQEARITDLLADGYEILDGLEHETRFRHVIFFPTRDMQGEWAEWRDARLLPEEKPHQAEITGRVRAVLPKGKRTHGHLCNGRGVLVLR